MISQETIGEILQTARIEEVIGDFVQLKRSGSNLKGLSPFSNEKTPSFMVSPTKQIFKDFSSGKGGNVVSFLMEHEQLTYPEALRYLARKYNIELHEDGEDEEAKEARMEKESLFVINEFAEKYFHDQLLNTDKGRSIGLSYFKERGFSEEMIEKFRLGYSHDDWDDLTQTALNKGYKLDFLEKAGLTKVKDEKRYDFFRGRVMFPIKNLTGRPIGFGGRILDSSKKTAKYFNSPESPIYDKSSVLFGLFEAKKAIGKEDKCYLVEGYTDVIAMHQAGIENVVATSGTALTKQQVRLIKRYTKNATIIFDGDEAGANASTRGLDLFLEEGLNVKVMALPQGEDPDSFSKGKETSELRNYLEEHAQDLITFKANTLAEEHRNDPVKKAEMIHGITDSVALIPDHVLRSFYIKECSEVLDVDEQALVLEVNKARRKKTKGPQERKEEKENLREEKPKREQRFEEPTTFYHQEKEIIRLLLEHSERTIKVPVYHEESEEERDEEVSIIWYILHELEKDGVGMEGSIHQRIMNLFHRFIEKDELPAPATVHKILQAEDPEAQEYAVHLTETPYELSDNWTVKHKIHPTEKDRNLLKIVQNAIFSLKTKKIEQMKKELDKELSGSEVNEELLASLQRLNEAKNRFSQELGRVVVK